jgi:hypothetical protein
LSVTEKRNRQFGFNFEMISYGSQSLNPLIIAIDQQSGSILSLLIINVVLLHHNGAQNAVGTLEIFIKVE